MAKKFLLAAGLALLLAAVLPASAQEAGWFAYLYNGATKDILRVNADGTQTSYNLGLDVNTFVSSYDMTFSADGSRVAYCAVTYPPGTGDTPGQPTATLYLRDLAASANLLEVNLGNAMGCRTGHGAFNETETQLAVGKVNYYPGDPAVNPTGPMWQLLVVDTASGSTVQELNNESQAVAEAPTLATSPIIPYVQKFAANQVIFAEVPYGIGGGAEWNAYAWATDAGTVTPIPHWGSIGLEQLDATLELLWIAVDPNLPAIEPTSPSPAYNVVKIANADMAESTIYHTSDHTVASAKFINGGQQVAVLLVPPFDPNVTTQPPSRWIALDRAGTVTDLQAIPTYSDLVNAPGGYALFQLEYEGENFTNPRFSLQWYNNGQMTELWSDAPQDPMVNWELAWGAPVPMASGLPPFPPLAQ